MNKKFVKLVAVMLGLMALSGCGANKTVTTGEKPTLRVLVQYSDMDYAEYPIGKMLEEETGYKVIYETLPNSNVEDKLNLLISSQEDYDLITVPCSATIKSLFYSYVEKGALEPLDELIEGTVNLKVMMDDPEFNGIKYEGKSYSIPTASNPDIRGGILVRADWIEKLGMQMPETIDEFTEVLRAIKASNFGPGQSNPVPLTADGTAVINNLVGAFGIACDWNDVDGKLVNRAEDPRMKQYLEYISILYNEGLLDEDFPINKYNTIQEKFTTGEAGMAYCSWWDTGSMVETVQKIDPTAKVEYLPVLTGPGGYKGVDKQYNLEMLSFIPKESKNKSAAIDWVDKKLDKEVFKNMFVGIEGIHHTVKDEEYYPIQPTFTNERDEAAKYRTGILKEDYAKYLRARRRQDETVFSFWKNLNQEMPEENIVNDYIGLVPYLPTYMSENQVFSTFTAENYINFATGITPIAEYDSFVKRCKEKKLTEMTEEINSWYVNSGLN